MGKNVPENIKYQLGPENNLLQLSAYFDKNPVGTYDYTTLHFALQPRVQFSRGIQEVMLNFSDESLNKV